MAVIATGNHPKALWPGIHAWWGQKYNEHMDYTAKMFEKTSSDKHYEELVQMSGFGLAPVKAEGSSTAYTGQSQGYVSRAIHTAYSLGYIVTHEELQDNLYEAVSRSRADALAKAMARTRNVVGANVYNRGFNSSYTGGDGVELLSTAHPTSAGNQSNELATAADFSEASLEDLCIQIANAQDDKGQKIALQPKCLIGPNELMFEFERVLKSDLRVDTANNDLNALKHMGIVPEAVVNPYLTDTDAWFVRTSGVTSGLTWFDREATSFKQDVDFDTDNAKAKSYMRFSTLWGDWRDIFGSPGA